jgi:hypothetical protein
MDAANVCLSTYQTAISENNDNVDDDTNTKNNCLNGVNMNGEGEDKGTGVVDYAIRSDEQVKNIAFSRLIFMYQPTTSPSN